MMFAELAVFATICAETGLFFGFFLPGESLLFTSGFLASQGVLNIWTLSIGSSIAAIGGDIIGYSVGSHLGIRLFTREDSFFFNKKHLANAHQFYEKQGSKAILIGRFIPIVRSFVPVIAGIGHMDYASFMKYNVIGGIIWASGITWMGYFVGS